MTLNLYEMTAEFYDFGNGRRVLQDDLGFYLNEFQAGQAILEVGCGTGRVGLELAKHGCEVSGLDLSIPMLNVFRRKLKSNPSLKVALFHADMTCFELSMLFDGIILPYRVFQALRSHDERIKCLESIKKHMKADTRVIVTMFDPNLKAMHDGYPKSFIDFDLYAADLGCHVRRIITEFEPDWERQIVFYEMICQKHRDGRVLEEYSERLELGFLLPRQAEALFLQNGFRIEATYGYYDYSARLEFEPREQIYVLGYKS